MPIRENFVEEQLCARSGLIALVAVGVNVKTRASSVQNPMGVKERVVEKLDLNDSPVIVADLKVSGNTVKFGDKFDEDENWLRHLSIKLKNRSDRPVTFVQLI